MLSKDAKWGWEIVDAQGRVVWRFDADGTGTPNLTLRNAPAPKASGELVVTVSRNKHDGRIQSMLRTDGCTEVNDLWDLIAVVRVPWTEGMGLEAESSDD